MAEAAEKFNRDKIFLHRKAREMLGQEITLKKEPFLLHWNINYYWWLSIGTIISANTWFFFFFLKS